MKSFRVKNTNKPPMRKKARWRSAGDNSLPFTEAHLGDSGSFHITLYTYQSSHPQNCWLANCTEKSARDDKSHVYRWRSPSPRVHLACDCGPDFLAHPQTCDFLMEVRRQTRKLTIFTHQIQLLI